MARKTRPKPTVWAGSGSMKRRAAAKAKPKAAPPEPVEVEVKLPDTKEGLIAEMIGLCDLVDQAMALQTRGEISFLGRWYRDKPWSEYAKLRGDLMGRMRALIEAEGGDPITGELEVEKALTIQHGVVPPWSRPGVFVIWCSFVPFVCLWGGWMQPHCSLSAVDGKVPFPEEGGSLHVDSTILPGAQTVDQHFQMELAEKTTAMSYQRNKRVPTFRLMPLDKDVRKRLAEGPLDPWIGETLKRGPVNPIPLPPHIKSVPFGLI